MELESGIRRALIVVDMQVGFGPKPDGELPVDGAMELVPIVNELMRLKQYAIVVATKDSHPPDHCSFKDFGGNWPKHCVIGSEGWMFLPGLNIHAMPYVVFKGTDRDRESYSGFDAPEMVGLLPCMRINHIDVCGLATDYCVLATALDGIEQGYALRVLEFAARAVAPDTEAKALKKMREAGIEIVEERSQLIF